MLCHKAAAQWFKTDEIWGTLDLQIDPGQRRRRGGKMSEGREMGRIGWGGASHPVPYSLKLE